MLGGTEQFFVVVLIQLEGSAKNIWFFVHFTMRKSPRRTIAKGAHFNFEHPSVQLGSFQVGNIRNRADKERNKGVIFEKESFWSEKEMKRRRKKTCKCLNIEYLEKKEIWFETSEEDQLQSF